MPEANAGFVASINSYDPLLGVRWGHFVGRWVVDRKSVIGDTEMWFLTRRTERFRRWLNDPSKSPATRRKVSEQYDEIREELQSAQYGRRVIMMPKVLSDQTFNALALMDIRRWGGYSRMADELEARESRREADEDRMMANERKALNNHTYDVLNWAWRHRDTQLTQENVRTKSLKEIIGTSEL